MKALVLFAHPVPESYGAALHTTIVETLQGRGWEVDDCDLNAEGFDPVMSAEDRRSYHDVQTNQTRVAGYVERLRAADALILSFPVWNFGYPAILKGFFDKVFLPGVSFRLEDGKVVPNLDNIKTLVAVTTYGGTRWRAFTAGDPPRRSVTRAVWHSTRPDKMKYLALYDMNRASDAKRAAFQAKVRHEMEVL
ncbi:NAD(P)H-dependent oxidoreductase [Chachezhania sediminis]|uniref:NAD(P)H-dependent oxidoreductase n=1 Tax=Chachezhania sediminis TaxID=2599291 RepID=UPI00131DDB4A|nr:NAD(P)H-dependent oxidoreductase [Chachezhania sediminis]